MKTACFKTYTGPGRISIARYAPRDAPAGYRVFKRLAPGKWFNSVNRPEYERLYNLEILGQLDPQEVLDQLIELGGGAEPILLCWEKPPFSVNNWCHRRMVADWFEKKLGISVPEYDPKPQQKLPL
jgi:Protein of unknown function, DUF488